MPHGPDVTFSPPSRIGEREFVLMIAMMQAMQALAIDAMLPALGDIALDLHAAHANDRQLIVGGFLVGSGLGSLVPGVLSDRYGRRPVLFVCLGAYFLLNVACALATSMTMLITLRVITGFFTSGMTVLPAAMIRDRFEGDRMARLQSMVSMIFLLVPALAPSLGQAVLLFAGWRWVFGIMAIMSAGLLLWSVLRLSESVTAENRQQISVSAIFHNMRDIVTTRESFGYVLALSAAATMFFNFLSTAQQLIGEHFGAGRMFPLFFAFLAGSMIIASLTNARLVMRFGARRVSHTALLSFIVVGAIQAYFAFGPHQSLIQFAVLTALTLGLTAFITANFTAIALQPFGRTAGAASSVLAFMRMVIGAVGGLIIGSMYDGSARPLAVTIMGAGLFALAFVLWSEKGRLFRRLHYPPQQG